MDLFDRFKIVHMACFQTALSELKSGKKKTDWMCFVFPQISGLRKDPFSELYSIGDVREAKMFLDDPEFGEDVILAATSLAELPTYDPVSIFGPEDSEQLRSSMTLFLAADPDARIFRIVLDKFFDGKADVDTIKIIERQSRGYM